MLDPERQPKYRKDALEEQYLRELNASVAPLEESLISSFQRPRLPIVFIVGPPRSSTTLVAQLLASTRAFSYVSNLVARFYMAPYLGMLIDRVARTGRPDHSFESQFGVTNGWDDPHEFGYFWNRWFPFGETHKLEAEELATVDGSLLSRECAAMESVRDCPLFFKNLTCGLQLGFLAELFPSSLFVACRRNPIYNMQSLLIAREQLFGDKRKWFSLKPREYRDLLHASPYDQVAGQLYYILKDIESAAAKLDAGRFLTVRYEDLCLQPSVQVGRICSKLNELGGRLQFKTATIPPRLDSQNEQRVGDADFERIRTAAARFFPEDSLRALI